MASTCFGGFLKHCGALAASNVVVLESDDPLHWQRAHDVRLGNLFWVGRSRSVIQRHDLRVTVPRETMEMGMPFQSSEM
jgi:hypothetical protein